MYNTIIVGGGAAGLFIAANLSGEGNILLEGSKKLGQKILITGGGMCNITNMDDTDKFLTKFGDNKRANFLKPALLNLNTNKTRDWLESIGLKLTIRDDGKVFPESLKAQTLINTLQKRASDNNILFKYNTKVTKIEVIPEGFAIYANNESYNCKNLILTTGGKSYPETGSDGSGYNLAKKLGHNIIDPTPALTGIKVSNYPFKSLSGNSIRSSNIDFFKPNSNKRFFNAIGDILFTHHGLSGPGIINNSRFIESGDILNISLITTDNKELKREELLNYMNSGNKSTIKRFFKDFGLTSSTTTLLLNYLSLNGDDIIKSLNKNLKSKIINTLLNFEIKVSEKIGFNAAMVTAGGVDITEINRKTMESKLVPNLYFAGEIIDIDGDTGGYNIQAAFSTAKLITDRLNNI